MHWSQRPQAPANSYPWGSARPFTETDWHFKAMAHLTQALEGWYEAVPDAYVSAGLPVYCEKGNKRRRVAPDVFVVLGYRSYCAATSYPGKKAVAQTSSSN
jgi:hypothetical protein